MQRRKVLLTIALVLVVVWLGESAVIQGTQAARPNVVAESHAPTALTSTMYLPLIAKPAPTIPYLLTKITLPAGSHPHGIALDVDRQRAFVGNHNGNSLSVIDTAALLVSTTIPLSSATGPNGVAYHAGTDRVFVANRDTDNLSVVDPMAGAWVSNIPVGQSPNGVLAHGDLIYVANFGSHSVSTLNAQTLIVTQTYLFSAASEPAMLAARDDIDLVYITSHGDNSLYTIQSGAIVQYSGVTAPYGVAFDGITDRVYIANRGDVRTVMTIDGGPQYGWLNVGQEPYVIGVNTRTGHIFVVLGDRIAVYDRRDQALITTIPIGTGAEEGIAIDQSRGLVYVSSGDTDEITVIQDTPTHDIAYVSQDSGAPAIWITDDSGQLHARQLSGPFQTHARQPTWHPDGRTLGFAGYNSPYGTEWDIWRMEAGGYNQVDLNQKPASCQIAGGSDPTEDLDPAWSPDGAHIAYRSDWNICVMDADWYGSNKQQLTFSLTARLPQWSPDGQWISFVAFADSGHEEVFIVPATGGTPINLTDNPAADLQPSWSADSHTIAFETNRHHVISGTTVITENWELYAVNISTTVQTRLTDSPGQDHAAAWSPDGRRIAVQGGLLENAEIYTIDIVSGVVTRLTNNAVEDSSPTWRPDTWQ